MKLADFFVAVSRWAEQLAGPLVGRQQKNLDRLRSLNAIEERLARMEADGVIDAAEGAEMVRMLRSQGLGTAEIEGLMEKLSRGDSSAIRSPTTLFADAVRDRLDGERIAVDDDRVDTQAQLDKLVFEYNHNRELASRVIASGHKADMAVIANCKA